jgi:hypothetical protein
MKFWCVDGVLIEIFKDPLLKAVDVFLVQWTKWTNIFYYVYVLFENVQYVNSCVNTCEAEAIYFVQNKAVSVK